MKMGIFRGFISVDITEIGELVSLWQNRRRPSRLVKAFAETHIKELEQKAAELLAMKSALEHLVHCCHGDDRPECPILEGLAGADAVAPAASAGKRRATQSARRVPA